MAELNNPNPAPVDGEDRSTGAGNGSAQMNPLRRLGSNVYTRGRLWIESLTLCERVGYIVAPLFIAALATYITFLGLHFGRRDDECRKCFQLMEGYNLTVLDVMASSNERHLMMCMLLCKKEPSCYDGFFDYSLEGDNCFLFSSPPAYYGHSPISSPTATTFIKRKKLEVPGAKYELAEEDNLYYYTSPDPMSYHEMLDYCSNGNKFYHPAIMGLNNSAYEVARRHYRRILQEGHQERKHGLLFLMAIGTPDSDSQYDLARGFAIKGHDSSSRDRLVRFIFYKYDMLEFLTDRDSSQQFFVLCQGDPLNLQDYNRLARSLFLRPV